MPELLLEKHLGALRPACEDAFKWMGKVGEGVVVTADVRDPRRRSGQRHRYWFAVLHTVWENSEAVQNQCGSFDVFRQMVLIELGCCHIIRLKDGTVQRIAMSVSFAKMEEATFGNLVDDTLAFFEKMGFDQKLLRTEADQRVGKV